MSAWRNCKASIRLATEINGRWPNRDRLSDGTIGDAAHAARNSDHNPWIKDPDGTGVVRARDIDEDLDGNPANGVGDANVIAEHLRALGKAGDVRLANWGYVIYEGRIAGGNPTRGPGRWEWRPYTGTNAHRHHVHVSFSRDPEGYDSTAPWGLWPTTTEPTTPEPGGPLMALTDAEQTELLTKVRELHDDYAVKGKSMRQVILETAQRTKDLVTGKRPGS